MKTILIYVHAHYAYYFFQSSIETYVYKNVMRVEDLEVHAGPSCQQAALLANDNDIKVHVRQGEMSRRENHMTIKRNVNSCDSVMIITSNSPGKLLENREWKQ